jgi:hypothetical protein
MPIAETQPRDAHGRWAGGLMDSLEHQLKAKGHPPDKAHDLAIEILTNRGHYDPKTQQLTKAGQEREDMSRRERRVDRHARMTGHDETEIGYKGGKAFVK